MTTTNVYFSHGTKNEQYLVEDLIIESLRMYGNEVMYIPRTLVSKDEILGEDRLSKFTSSFPIEMYFENVDSFGGQGAFIQKFGLMMEQTATLVVARRRWDQFVGRYGVTTVPSRPCEGDLIYFPLSKGLFEIKFVAHQDPFYQLGKLYVYKLQVELFQYGSEAIDTGNKDIDVFESLKTLNVNPTRNIHGEVTKITLTNGGRNYTIAPIVTFTSSTGRGAAASATIANGRVTDLTLISAGTGYATAPTIVFTGDDGTGASAIAEITANIDNSADSFGDNTKFKTEAASILFNANNPFGEVQSTPPSVIVPSFDVDSTAITTDSEILTTDIV
jgi:hypothetical protein